MGVAGSNPTGPSKSSDTNRAIPSDRFSSPPQQLSPNCAEENEIDVAQERSIPDDWWPEWMQDLASEDPLGSDPVVVAAIEATDAEHQRYRQFFTALAPADTLDDLLAHPGGVGDPVPLGVLLQGPLEGHHLPIVALIGQLRTQSARLTRSIVALGMGRPTHCSELVALRSRVRSAARHMSRPLVNITLSIFD